MAPRLAVLALGLLGLTLAALPPAQGGGPTLVEGDVAGIWTLEGSPYILVGNATVQAGTALTILAGVEVRATRATALTVYGSLLVEGTTDAPVRFDGEGSAVDAGFWRGIQASTAPATTETIRLTDAIVAHAESGLTVSGGTAYVERSSFGAGVRGITVFNGGATIVDSVLSGNTMAGVHSRASSLTISHSLFSGNKVGLDVGAVRALAENTTFLGPTTADASLDLGSEVTFRVVARGSLLRFADAASRLHDEGILAVSVTDAHGTGVRGASVRIEDNGNATTVVTATTNGEGRVPGVVVTERTTAIAGATDFNPFTVTASAHGFERTVSVFVDGNADVTLALPADLSPPTPIAARFLAVNEDVPVPFDASGSTDNDPTFKVTTGSFRWSFPEVGVELTGMSTAYTFATPGLYQGVLTATDAAGNEAFVSFAVRVNDVTAPVLSEVMTPDRGALGDPLRFQAAASDNDPANPPSIVWRFTSGATTIRRNGATVQVTLPSAGTWSVTATATDAAGNTVVEERQVVIVAPPPPNPWPWIGGGAALFAAALAGATERGKVGLLSLFLPLYTRLRDDEVLDQFTRGQIYGHIRVHPGDTYTDIKRNLALNNGTLTYHLAVLEREGLVRAVNKGVHKLLYPIDVRPPEDGGGLHELEQRLLRILREAPGTGVTDLAGVLGISRQLALYHLRLLSKQGLVRLERRGVRLCAFGLETSSVRDAGGRLQEAP